MDAMNIAIIALAAILGTALGSFLNVCIDRLPRRESVVGGRSHCDSCKRELKPSEMIPIVSYIALRGRCASCGAPIPVRVVLVETATAVLFGGLAGVLGISPISGLLALYGCILIVVFVIDLEHKLILNVVVYPSIVLAFVVALIMPPPWLGSVGPHPVANAGLGAAIGFGLLFVIALVSRGMGWGDVKFAAFMGAATGLPLVLVALFVGVFVGGLVGIVLLVSGKKGRKQAIPFGPFLAIGMMTTLLWGPGMLAWYLGLM